MQLKETDTNKLLQTAEMISFVPESDWHWERRDNGGRVLVLAPV